MERVYLKLSHYHTEYTAVRCWLVVLCCDAVLYFLEREALQRKESKVRNVQSLHYLTYKTKIEQIQRYEVLDYFGSTAPRVVAT